MPPIGRQKPSRDGLVVVGNGPSLLESGLGSVIDSFATVVRFNEYRTEPPFDQHVGTKTDIWFACGNYQNTKEHAESRKITWRHPSLVREIIFVGFGDVEGYKTYQALKETCDEYRTPIQPICQDLVSQCRKEMPLAEPFKGTSRTTAVPSSGALALAHFCREGAGPIFICGFDFLKGPQHHYWARYKRNPIGWHSPDAEESFISNLIHAGSVSVLI